MKPKIKKQVKLKPIQAFAVMKKGELVMAGNFSYYLYENPISAEILAEDIKGAKVIKVKITPLEGKKIKG